MIAEPLPTVPFENLNLAKTPSPTPAKLQFEDCAAAEATTRTTKLPVVVLPSLSVALTFTAVSPIVKKLPLAGVESGTSAPSSASFADTVKLTFAPAGFVATATTGEAGSVRT